MLSSVVVGLETVFVGRVFGLGIARVVGEGSGVDAGVAS